MNQGQFEVIVTELRQMNGKLTNLIHELQEQREAGLHEFLSPDVASALEAEGFLNVGIVRRADDEQLLMVKGIGPATLKEIREALR